MHRSIRCLPLVCGLALAANPSAPVPRAEKSDAEEIVDAARELFDEYAPDEIKEQFAFPSAKEWDEFAQRLQQALESNDLRRLAAYEPEARAALVALRALPEYYEYADWLSERLDYIEMAKATLKTKSPPRPTPPGRPPTPKDPAPRDPTAPGATVEIPHYEPWLARMKQRPAPGRATALLPRVQAVFREEGLPPELAWLAEAESTFNPRALSPVGAKGLFQLMPETAKSLGLQTFLPDERTNPEKSARAAAQYLRKLYGRFGGWPLALAAYNAGEGRVGRMLAKQNATTFAEIADDLPAETRMYVPKVLATIEARAGLAPALLPGPRT
jgi:membrane-bound lytic murein transglycosylase D